MKKFYVAQDESGKFSILAFSQAGGVVCDYGWKMEKDLLSLLLSLSFCLSPPPSNFLSSFQNIV